MKLRRGKTKNLLEGSIDAALLAVEVYNKPRTTFRSQAYIVLMIIAWTRLFHAYFNKTKGNTYFYKEKGRYVDINGERKAWELKTCINRYGNLSEAVKANLQFFIDLRNKIEHHNVAEREVDTSIFGECQALLYNYEKLLIDLFGTEYAINESLAFSLQFSQMRSPEQKQASKMVLSAEMQKIWDYIDKYRSNLSDEVFNSQEFSIKVLQIPKISNTNRNDLAIEFVKWNELDPKDREIYRKTTAIIKNKRVVVEAKNHGRLRAREVMRRIKKETRVGFNQHHHTWLVTIFSVRPPAKDPTPENTNTKYCHYDYAHKDYLYQESWVEFIVKLFEIHHVTIEKIHQAYKYNEKWDINEYC